MAAIGRTVTALWCGLLAMPAFAAETSAGVCPPSGTTEVRWIGNGLMRGGKGYVSTPMGQVHYRLVRAGDGPVLVLLHQTPWSMNQYAEVQACLAARGYPEVRAPRWTRDDFGPRFAGPYVELTGLYAEQTRASGAALGIAAPLACLAAALWIASAVSTGFDIPVAYAETGRAIATASVATNAMSGPLPATLMRRTIRYTRAPSSAHAALGGWLPQSRSLRASTTAHTMPSRYGIASTESTRGCAVT